MSKARGIRFENYVKRKLEQQGYFVVRAAASKPVDLVIIKNGEVMLVECKFNNYLSPEDREKLAEISKKTGLKVMIATHHNGKVVLLPLESFERDNKKIRRI